MNAKMAQMAAQFLQRTQLSGAEVPAFLSVMQALDAIVRAPVASPPAASDPTPR